MSFLLGVDLGTSSCKCTLMSNEGTVIGSSKFEYSSLFPKPGWVEQNPDVWYRAFVESIRMVLRKTESRAIDISAIGVAGQMRGLTLLDDLRNPVRNSILWNDTRCFSEVESLNRHDSELLRSITLNPLNTMCTLPKILWVMKNEPDNWSKTDVFLYPKDYINFRLTGVLSTDHSDASGSSFYDVKHQIWSEELLSKFDIAQSKLPVIHSSDEVIGQLTNEAAKDLGLEAGIPVISGGSDSTIETLSIGITDERKCKIRLGTSGAISTVVSSLEGINEKLYCWSYSLTNKWLLDTNTRSCGQSISWLKECVYSSKKESALNTIAEEAMSSPPGSNGIVYHPYLLGEDAPYWDPELRGSFVGLSAKHNRSDLARAVYEGTAYALRDAQETFLDLNSGFQKYIFVGGGTKNEIWLSIIADVLRLDGEVPLQSDASFGAALLSGVGTDVFASLEEALRICVKPMRKIRHNERNSRIYDGLFSQYKLIQQKLGGFYALRRRGTDE